MHRVQPHVASVLTLIVVVCVASWTGLVSSQGRWDDEIAAFERADRVSPPPPGGIVFVGSSSIRLWDLERWFPDKGYLNRGFGGSQIADSVEHLDVLVLRHQPRIVVMYAGDNDIAAGKTATQVADDFKTFVAKIHDARPETRIAFIGIKPSIARWALIDSMRAANDLIRDFCNADDRLAFIDIDGPMLGWDGQPRPELLVDDGLHLSERGYRLWSTLVEPFLD